MSKLQDQEMPDSFYIKILQACWIERFKTDDFVMIQGEKGEKFYMILEGKLQFLANDESKTKTLQKLNKEEQLQEKRQSLPSVNIVMTQVKTTPPIT